MSAEGGVGEAAGRVGNTLAGKKGKTKEKSE